MRLVLRSLPQMLVIAGIVTTALFVPIVAVLALLAFTLFGVSLRSFVTFGHTLTILEGVLVWWAVVYLPAMAYSVFVMPWKSKE
jgi:hypothetical protein